MILEGEHITIWWFRVFTIGPGAKSSKAFVILVEGVVESMERLLLARLVHVAAKSKGRSVRGTLGGVGTGPIQTWVNRPGRTAGL